MGVLSLLVKLGLDASAFEMGLKRTQSVGEKFGNSFKSAITTQLAGALSVAAVTGFAKSIVSLADDIGDLAEQLNISTDDVQRFQALAGESGVKFESIAGAINRVNDARIAALASDGPQREAFRKLGLSINYLGQESVGSEQVLIKLGAALNANRNDADMMAAATDLLGLKLVKAALAAGKFNNLGPISLFKKSDIEALGKFNDAVERLEKTSKVTAAPILTAATDPLERVLKTFELIRQEAGIIAALLSLPAQIPSVISQMAVGKKPVVNPEDDPTSPRFRGPRSEYEQIRGQAFSFGGGQDSLARIGGFTGFQSSQDTAIKQAIEQTIQLKLIAKSSATTAQVMTRE